MFFGVGFCIFQRFACGGGYFSHFYAEKVTFSKSGGNRLIGTGIIKIP